ncbi:MAG: hypothetical protein Q8P31_12190 [Bacillota bacterium]|nr:hypothetical protein [Bacillota bacterium]
MSHLLALPAGLAAAAVAYLINRSALRRLGGRALWLAIPVLEETFKTGLAILAGASVVSTHAVFGAVEAVYEVSGRRPSVTAAGLALMTHALLGLLTASLISPGRPAAFAVGSAAAVHTAYNLLVTGRAASSKGNPPNREGGER